jgi:hypothetical protein
MKTLHSFKIVERNEYQIVEDIHPKINFTIDEEASLDDMLYAFERFLRAAGYVLPENCSLNFIEN